jgi:hypothetical protein
LYWNRRKASKLAALNCEENDVQAPTRVFFAKRVHKVLKTNDRRCRKARKRSEDAENNIDNAETTRI